MDEKWRREVLSKHFFGTWRCKLREKTLFSQLRSDGGPKIGVKSYAACLRADRVCLHNSCSSGKSLAAHGWNWKIVSWQHLFGFVMNASLKGAWNTWPWSHLNTRLCFSLFPKSFNLAWGFVSCGGHSFMYPSQTLFGLGVSSETCYLHSLSEVYLIWSNKVNCDKHLCHHFLWVWWWCNHS